MSIGTEALKPTSLPPARSSYQHKALSLLPILSLWICLVLALAVRVWFVIRTHGVIEGDESMVAIQAQHILYGERPVYFFGQQYMGSFEAYLMAIFFSIMGQTVWAVRAETTCLSLILVWLTWKLAAALTNGLRLPEYARAAFIFIATFCAAIPPTYDLVIQLRTLGGYIEAYLIILALLFVALRITQRWQDASTGEAVLRWVIMGFLIGLGVWINPLMAVAIVTTIIWIAGYCTWTIWQRRQPLSATVKKLLLALTSLPPALVGAAPAIYWGYYNQWANVKYIFSSGSVPYAGESRTRTLLQVTKLYVTCNVPRVIGGALPTETDVSAIHPHLLTPALIFGFVCIIVTIAAVVFSCFKPSLLLQQARSLVTLPLLFCICSASVFCFSSRSVAGLVTHCGSTDLVGRYTTPIMLALPFFIATAFVVVLIAVLGLKHKSEGSETEKNVAHPLNVSRQLPNSRVATLLLSALLIIFLFNTGAQLYKYHKADAYYTFQTSGCTIAPREYEPLITYLQQENIHFVWASMWIANPLLFRTQSHIIAIDPRLADANNSRIPEYTHAILKANNPSIIELVGQGTSTTHLLKKLDQQGITYHTKRLFASPGVDMLVITPSTFVSPNISNNLDAWFRGC